MQHAFAISFVLLILLTTHGCYCAAVRVVNSLPAEWKLWKEKHNKSYTGWHEELKSHVIWTANQAFIDAHNSYKEFFGFTLGMNSFGDLSDYDYHKKYNCILAPQYSTGFNSKYRKLYKRPNENVSVAESVDWRTMGAVTNVKQQAECCSSYAFGALGALEGVHALATGTKVDLSAQNILDCSWIYGNRGCYKGSMENTYLYIVENGGIDTSKTYPYIGKLNKCSYRASGVGATMKYFVEIESGDESALQAAVATQGPVATLVEASHNVFRFYRSGVLNVPNCVSFKVTQSVVVIGYGASYGRDYWLIKNSWGEDWGQDGFAMMSRNKYNQCGIATSAMFPSI